VQNEENILKYSVKAAIDWFFKRSPVTYFIGAVLGVAVIVLSGNLSLNVSDSSIKISYGNDLTIYSFYLVILCCLLAFGALRLQMKERYLKLMKENELALIEKQGVLKRESEKELEELKTQLELEKNKAQNKHNNLGKASNELLRKIAKLEKIFAGYIGSGAVVPVYIDGERADIFIANAINEQHKFKKLYINDKELFESWKKMLSYLDESQIAITRSINGEKLNLGPLSKAALFISEYLNQISNSGHTVVIEN